MATKKYIVENRTTKLLRTDNPDKAYNKALDLMDAKEPYITLTDHPKGIIDTYTLEPGQQNYRVKVTKIKPEPGK